MLMKCRNYNELSLVENRPKHKTYDNADAKNTLIIPINKSCSPLRYSSTKLRYSFYQTAVHILSSDGPVIEKQQTRGDTITVLENQLKSKKSDNKKCHLKNRKKWLIN